MTTNIRKYIMHADVSDVFTECLILNDGKTAKVIYMRANSSDNTIANNALNIGRNVFDVDVSDDELSIESVNISNDGKIVFLNVLFEPSPESQPSLIECNWNDIYKPKATVAFPMWCGTCRGFK